MIGGRVAGTIRHGDVDTGAWDRLMGWTALNQPDRLLATLDMEPQLVLDPEYSADGAVEHRALAAEMAGVQPWVVRPLAPVTRLQ